MYILSIGLAITLGKLYNLLCFSPLITKIWIIIKYVLIGLWQGLNEIICVRLAKILAHGIVCSLNIFHCISIIIISDAVHGT